MPSSTSTTSETSISTTSETSLSSTSSSISEVLIESEILVRVRKLVNDTGSVRFSDKELFLWMSDAIRRIRKIRPDTKLDEDGNLTSFTEIYTSSDTIPLNDDWRKVITNYMCFRAFSEMAADDASRARSTEYKQLFDESLTIT